MNKQSGFNESTKRKRYSDIDDHFIRQKKLNLLSHYKVGRMWDNDMKMVGESLKKIRETLQSRKAKIIFPARPRLQIAKILDRRSSNQINKEPLNSQRTNSLETHPIEFIVENSFKQIPKVDQTQQTEGPEFQQAYLAEGSFQGYTLQESLGLILKHKQQLTIIKKKRYPSIEGQNIKKSQFKSLNTEVVNQDPLQLLSDQNIFSINRNPGSSQLLGTFLPNLKYYKKIKDVKDPNNEGDLIKIYGQKSERVSLNTDQANELYLKSFRSSLPQLGIRYA